MLAKLNPHPRDERIRIEQQPGRRQNTYIDGKLCNGWGVTRLLNRWFPNTFDADEFYKNDKEKRKADEKMNMRDTNIGVFLSLCAENFLNDEPFSPSPLFPEFKCFEDVPGFKNFKLAYAAIPSTWVRYRVEWSLFCDIKEVTGKPDIVFRDMADPLCLNLIIVDLKYIKKPKNWFCSKNDRIVEKRTNCKKSTSSNAEDHEPSCAARCQFELSHMMSTKVMKCGAQMALYRAMLLERYQEQSKPPIVINKMVGWFLRPEFEYMHVFEQDQIALFDPAAHYVFIADKKE